jgi:hypothetical protein
VGVEKWLVVVDAANWDARNVLNSASFTWAKVNKRDEERKKERKRKNGHCID